MKNINTNTLSDDELVRAVAQDQQPAYFEMLYRRYYHRVLDKCYSLVKNRIIAEELTEDIFTNTYERLASFSHRSSFSSWLYSITYNHCIDYLRKKNKQQYTVWSRENEIPEIMDETDESIEDIAYDKLLDILELVHPEEKALLLMKYQEDLSVKQISAALGISDDAVKMRLKRARNRVLFLYTKKYLGDR